jgi:hypothetical protein
MSVVHSNRYAACPWHKAGLWPEVDSVLISMIVAFQSQPMHSAQTTSLELAGVRNLLQATGTLPTVEDNAEQLSVSPVGAFEDLIAVEQRAAVVRARSASFLPLSLPQSCPILLSSSLSRKDAAHGYFDRTRLGTADE